MLIAVPARATADIAARYGADGHASKGADRIGFVSAISRWDAGARELTVGLFPFDVNDEDVQKVADWRMMFYATVGKESPNPARWPDPPYVLVMLRLPGDKEEYTEADIDAYGLNVVGWRGSETTATFLMGPDVLTVVEKLYFKPDDIGSLIIKLRETMDRDMLEGFRYDASVHGN